MVGRGSEREPSAGKSEDAGAKGRGLAARVQAAGRFLGPGSAVLVFLLMSGLPTMTHAGRVSAALAAWMAVWWLTEAVHVSVTALLPVTVLPILGGATVKAAAAPYGHPLIFLFMGGFMLSLAMERFGLHRRIALLILSVVGGKPANIVGGFMISSAVMSMWVSNTATAIMMLPIAASVLKTAGSGDDPGTAGQGALDAAQNFGIASLLGIAYGCSIGGMGTIVGSPPNLFVVSYLREHFERDISFLEWMKFGLPLVVVLLPLTWFLLTQVFYPLGAVHRETHGRSFKQELREMGPVGRGEWVVLFVFGATVLGWLFRPLLARFELHSVTPLAGLSDAGIAMMGACILFLIPVDRARGVFAMNWDTASRLPWGILLLFGGGLSLASALASNKVDQLIGTALSGLGAIPQWSIVLLVVVTVVFVTELTSNTATTATLVPILAGIAPGLGVHRELLMIPAAMAASCAFMMPVATPPNAIVFGSGMITIPQMARAGIWLNGVAALTILVFSLLVLG